MPRLQAPDNGVTVRMYRQGHGDCFLMAFPRQGGGDPVYVLIDCGLKPGSQNFVSGTKIGDVVEHIGEATNHKLDLMIITHEHQDHVNGIWKKVNPYFQDFEIDEAWLAWTEDPNDDLANDIRERHRDQLLQLVQARSELAIAMGPDDDGVVLLDSLMSLEFGDENDSFEAALAVASDPTKSRNKQAMKLVKDKAAQNRGVRYLMPGGAAHAVPQTEGVRAYVLGPPRSEKLLKDEDPLGGEGFPESHEFSFMAAVEGDPDGPQAPFGRPFAVTPAEAFADQFFEDHYGSAGPDQPGKDGSQVSDDAAWRRIDNDWLRSAESLALKMNRGINNTSLVLAFELPASKKILLFVGDAQRGNWISWDDQKYGADESVEARELLARTVLYKVGHHGSHNATLAGSRDDDYPNLAWMGTGQFAAEFTSMITAVNEWAMTKNTPPWRHPLPSIRSALEVKSQGRVFQTDTDELTKPTALSDAAWAEFMDRTSIDPLFFDYEIRDV